MAHSLDFLRSKDASAGRKARGSKFIVWAEVQSFVHEELDADSAEHAQDLARHWVDTMGAISASFRRVFPDGGIGPAIAIYEGEV